MPQLKRQHSAEPLADSAADTPTSGTTPPATERSVTPPKAMESTEQAPPTADPTELFLGSPLKKQRASVSTADENALRRRIAESSGRMNEVLGTGATENKTATASTGAAGNQIDSGTPSINIHPHDEEEL